MKTNIPGPKCIYCFGYYANKTVRIHFEENRLLNFMTV